jgi:hypothetical protein
MCCILWKCMRVYWRLCCNFVEVDVYKVTTESPMHSLFLDKMTISSLDDNSTQISLHMLCHI